MLEGELEPTSVDGDNRYRKVVRRHLDAVLDRDVVGAGGVLGRKLPASAPEFEPRERPRRACGARLVSLAPILILAFEKRTILAALRRGREGVHDRLARLANELLAAHGARELASLRGEQVVRRNALAGEPPEHRL